MFSNCQAIKLGRPKGNPWETRLQDENKNYFQEMKEEREKEKRRERERERTKNSENRDCILQKRQISQISQF